MSDAEAVHREIDSIVEDLARTMHLRLLAQMSDGRDLCVGTADSMDSVYIDGMVNISDLARMIINAQMLNEGVDPSWLYAP